jgi:hypothetical protein
VGCADVGEIFGGGSDKLKYVNWMDMKGVRSNIDRWIAEA